MTDTELQEALGLAKDFQTGNVYCPTIPDCEALARALLHVHARLEKAEKVAIQANRFEEIQRRPDVYFEESNYAYEALQIALKAWREKK